MTFFFTNLAALTPAELEQLVARHPAEKRQAKDEINVPIALGAFRDK